MALRRNQKTTCPACSAKTDRSSKYCSHCGAEVAKPDAETGGTESQPERPAQRRLFLKIAIGASIVLAIAGAGAGVYLKIQHDNEVKREKAIAEKRAAAQKAAIARYEACDRASSELLDELQGVDARLDVGMTYDEYTDFVSEVNVEYERQDTSDMDLDCLSDVAVPAETAVNEYVKAARRWNDCIDDLDCNVDNIDLQRYWTRASEASSQATFALSELKP